MRTHQQKKSLGFLSIVAFLMVLVGVGYTVSSVFAVTREPSIQPVSSPIPENSDPSLKESFFSSMEEHVAEKAISLWNEICGCVEDTSSDTGDSEESQNSFSDVHSSASAVITLMPRALPSVYDDIALSDYKDAILILYSNGLLQKGTSFHPTRVVPITDFIRVVMDVYRLQHHYDIISLEGLTEKEYFSFNVPREVLMRINSAYEQGLLTKLALEDANGHSRLELPISPIEAKDMLLAIQKKSPEIVTNIPTFAFMSHQTLLKEEMAQFVVSAFGLKLNERSLPVFSDISGTPYQDAIQRLAMLGIVDGVNGKYYPSATLENKDFVTLLIRALVYRQGKPIVVDNFYYLNHLTNVSTTATYAPYLEYCLELEMCTSLLTQTPGGVTFQADRLLSRSEIIPIVSTLTQVKFDLPNALKGEYLTRGELAHLIVNLFQLEEKPVAEKSENPIADMASSGSRSPSRRKTFQELMSIQ